MKDNLESTLATLTQAQGLLQQVEVNLRRQASIQGSGTDGMQQMIQAVSCMFGVPVREIFGRSRRAPIITARHVVWWVAHKLWNLPSNEIAALFETHHTTILHGANRITDRRSVEASFASLTNKLSQQIQPFQPKP